MYFFFDTETTGIPQNYKAPASDLNNWPRLVQIAWLITDKDANELSSAEYIIKPNGFTIPEDAAKVHGITTEIATQNGIDLSGVLPTVVREIDNVSVLFTHNMPFDEKILGAELLRSGYPNIVETKRRRCTMQESTDYCRLPGHYGYKWPTLQELHNKLFDESFSGAHQAIVDVRACAKCYFELRRRKVVE